ncbi:MAG TPA: glycoside-pentoside-hexuronide (GPH):cation symporter [Clostridiales bacterium]|nr:glycoside-pentoside-hexuronide (GPH):cation symporter [Clostridiales bacterium]HQH62504.1 glycoside-pentoside-hexuronide (GPH):cation symporter [Clostridiales bacterium]HQK73129.1 glycoside-pentoside-hexuronide (GPH):cation symporter [Clostridiales bacterium]
MNTSAGAYSPGGITWKDKIGYALGDFSGLLFFGVVGAFLQMFYTDVLYLDLGKIAALIVIARIWDAVNDPLWGAVIDMRKPGKYGKFRPYLLWVCVPLAVSAVLMFLKIPGLTQTQYLVYAYVTYILYGMMYTGINIPYGSLASVITADENERSSLSLYRSLGSGLGGLPGQVLLPLFIFSTDALTGKKYLDSDKLGLAMLAFAVVSVAFYLVSFSMIRERVPFPASKPRLNVGKTVKTLLKNRPFIVLCVASMLLIASQIYTTNLNSYLFKDYFKKPELISVATVALYAPMALVLPLTGKLVRRFGKKELCGAGGLFAAAASAVLLLIKTQNPYVFLSFSFLTGLGTSFFVLLVWALVTDVIDYQEYLTDQREEGICYAFFSFMRKLGHSVSGLLGVWVLQLIGYDAKNITAAATQKMYGVAVLMPGLLYLGIFVFLTLLYPLGKKKLQQLHENEYRLMREEQAGG